MNKTKQLAIACTTILCTTLLFTGCANYQLGTMLPDDIKTVYVPTFVNKTMEPQIEFTTTSTTINEIQKDGSLQIAGEADADTILLVTLTDYRLDPLAYEDNRTTTTEEYRSIITASVVFQRNNDGTILAEYPVVTGDSTFLMSGDFTSSKQKALPDTAKDLAHEIVQKIVETW